MPWFRNICNLCMYAIIAVQFQTCFIKVVQDIEYESCMHSSEIRHGPVNMMVFYGTNTTLNCTGIEHSTVVKWIYYADGSLPINITYMNSTLFTRYDLYLGIVGLEHAGVYGCYSADGEHRAQLIILGNVHEDSLVFWWLIRVWWLTRVLITHVLLHGSLAKRQNKKVPQHLHVRQLLYVVCV